MQEATPAASSATCCKPVGAELIRNGLFALRHRAELRSLPARAQDQVYLLSPPEGRPLLSRDGPEIDLFAGTFGRCRGC